MKRMKIVILVVGMFLVTSMTAVSATWTTTELFESTPVIKTTVSGDEELDQYMTNYEDAAPFIGNVSFFGVNLSIAQSFKPQKEILTRVQLFMAKNITTSYPCTVAIRDNLTGENLAITSKSPEDFPTVNESAPQKNLSWIDFDFDNITVTLSKTYYIVAYTANTTDNFYWVGGNGTNPYINGNISISLDDGETWGSFIEADGCFKTYGKDDPELDQYQTNVTGGIPVGNFKLSPTDRRNWTMAQSFIPTKEVLTKVALCLARNTTPPTIYPIIVAIRNNLTEENLAVVSANPEDVPMFNDTDPIESILFIEFDFDDIHVTPGETYYIVAYTKNATDNLYVWGSDISDSYLNGDAWVSWDNGTTWENSSGTVDMCFKTYGHDVPTTDLQIGIKGGLGVTLSVKNIGDVDATGVQVDYSIKGGILKRINDTSGLLILSLTPGEETPIQRQILGLGKISITVTSEASNTNKVTKEVDGIVLLCFVIMLP